MRFLQVFTMGKVNWSNACNKIQHFNSLELYSHPHTTSLSISERNLLHLVTLRYIYVAFIQLSIIEASLSLLISAHNMFCLLTMILQRTSNVYSLISLNIYGSNKLNINISNFIHLAHKVFIYFDAFYMPCFFFFELAHLKLLLMVIMEYISDIRQWNWDK